MTYIVNAVRIPDGRFRICRSHRYDMRVPVQFRVGNVPHTVRKQCSDYQQKSGDSRNHWRDDGIGAWRNKGQLAGATGQAAGVFSN